MKLLNLLIIFNLILFSHAQCKNSKWDDHSQKQITTHLTTELDENTVAIRVKGLVCASCGIGIRKKIPKLDAVNRDRYKKGVEMDPYRMLVKIAVKEGLSLSPEAVKKAVEDAGYEAVYYYQKSGGKVSVKTL